MSASKSKSKSCVVTGTIIAIALTALMCGVYGLLVKKSKETKGGRGGEAYPVLR